ncbi:unknown [Gryllus bimaculatus nudivirus]|uniref:Uncharacterized protein n=1 Tax=Gryllus bimaculatus nudivirus TaxID=432587 RepID=A4L216_9VIRU|nr:hypothetical protein GrBNV_gp53 [Gryllus bimaculatus nudivirus]ABO45386.1 unknown [Gryllus bimaculatus nudivirus]
MSGLIVLQEQVLDLIQRIQLPDDVNVHKKYNPLISKLIYLNVIKDENDILHFDCLLEDIKKTYTCSNVDIINFNIMRQIFQNLLKINLLIEKYNLLNKTVEALLYNFYSNVNKL